MECNTKCNTKQCTNHIYKHVYFSQIEFVHEISIRIKKQDITNISEAVYAL